MLTRKLSYYIWDGTYQSQHEKAIVDALIHNRPFTLFLNQHDQPVTFGWTYANS